MSPKKKTEKSNKIRSPGFGKRVRAVRKHLKLNQQEMAEKLNLALPTLSEVENGKSYPCYDFFYNMFEHFNVNLFYLLFGMGEMFGYPGKDDRKRDIDPIEKELRLIITRDDLSEFFHHFLGSKILQHHLVSEYYAFMLKKRKEIEMEMKALMEEEDPDEEHPHAERGLHGDPL